MVMNVVPIHIDGVCVRWRTELLESDGVWLTSSDYSHPFQPAVITRPSHFSRRGSKNFSRLVAQIFDKTRGNNSSPEISSEYREVRTDGDDFGSGRARVELPGISKRCESPPLLAMNDVSTSTRTTGACGSILGNAFHLESPMLFDSVLAVSSDDDHKRPRAMSKNDFEIVSLIGYGHSGTVVSLVKSKESGTFYAMKTVDKWSLIEQRNAGDPKAVERAVAERDLHVRHADGSPFFVKFYYSFQTPKNLYYILEYCPIDVLEYINQFGPLSLKDFLMFVAELSVAVERLHRSGSIHRDIKADNILISTSGHVRLSDFGSSKTVNSDRCDSVVGFSVCSMPPEFFGTTPSYGSAIDWFQVGIVAYEVVTGYEPFKGRPLRTVDSPFYPPSWPELGEEIPEAVRSLVEAFLHPDEAQRLTSFIDIKSHSAFCGIIDWDVVQVGDPIECPFPNLAGDHPHFSYATPRMMSSVSSDHDYDPLPFKSFSYIRP